MMTDLNSPYARTLHLELLAHYPPEEGWRWHTNILFEGTQLSHVLRHAKYPTVLVAPMPIPVVSPRHVATAQHLMQAFAQCQHGGRSTVVLVYVHLLHEPVKLAKGVQLLNIVIEPTPKQELQNATYAHSN